MNRSMWKSSPYIGPIIQMTNLVFAIGLSIGPQVVKPYLGRYDEDIEGIQPIQMAYLVLAVINMFMVIFLVLSATLFGLYTDQCNNVHEVLFQVDDDDIEVIPDEPDTLSVTEVEPPQPTKLDPCSRPGRLLVALVTLAFTVMAGQCLMFACLLYTYLYEYLHWSVNAATTLYSVYYVVLFLVGAIIVPLSRWVSPTKLVVFDMTSLLLSSILMFVALRQEDAGDILTTAGVLVSALGDSNILPTFITLAEQSLLVIPRVMSLFVAGFGAAMIIMGPVAGVSLNFSVESYPTLMLALVLACILVLVLYFGCIHWLKNSGQWPGTMESTRPENDRQSAQE